MTEATARPELTLPEAEAALLHAEYARAGVILEYGSGGSTALAAGMPGKTVFSVESDRDWAQMMRRWFAENPPAAGSEVDIIWSDIGPTKEWGHPVDEIEWRSFPEYPLKVWELPEFRQPDVVLVDGRFREGCALAAAFLTEKPLVLLFDDYAPRKHYHKVEHWLGQPQMTGRMARFEIVPQAFPVKDLLRIMKLTVRP
ncbi:hypothetical protein PVT71_01010 [Salipiger sp. H15]|uniref:Class I SAM-dependent methyltransferase n=1 Tax=Alloyangia sp. H15 TaxID=3029062 RepID=A0AAU8AH33_9RHOB